MSTVFDVDGIEISQQNDIPMTGSLSTTPAEVSIITTPVESIEISNIGDTVVTEVQVPGIQGAPGVQNVYVSSTDPSTGWGPEQSGYVWIKV